jgi:electron transfer flavoprotein beta subunit
MRIVVVIKPGARLGESDSLAVEQALRVARRRIAVNVTVLVAGPEGSVRALRAALALGADDGVHVLDDDLATADVLALSRVYAAALRFTGFDLALCAASSEAPNLAATPAMLAERLGVPLLARAGSLAVGGPDPDEIIAVCDEGRFLVERAARPPAIASVADHAAVPEYPSFPAVLEARRKLVRTLTVAGLGIDPARVRRPGAATAAGDTTPCPRARMIHIAGDDPGAAAARLADFLAERDFIES